MINKENTPIQPISVNIAPCYAVPSNFAELPEIHDVNSCEIVILGIQID